MHRRTAWFAVAMLLALASSPGDHRVVDARGEDGGLSEPRDSSDLDTLAADTVERYREYRASLERVLALREAAMDRAARLVERHEALYRDRVISQAELTQSQEALARARAGADEARRSMAEADQLIGEALAMEQLAKLPPLPVGGYVAVDTAIRYNGPVRWSLAETPNLARFFEARFGRPLPLSAVGQTAAHDRIGFDHRHAIDVAVHPDSTEGRALMDHLRSLGIPFLAFRGAVPGSATGAHIHVGPPSLRLARPR